MISKCYNFQKHTFNNSIFENNIDATYIINLENNGRLDHIMNQLLLYQPTKIVYICFNKGYKKCKKDDFINNPPYDLIDAFINIFKHAEMMNYDNILVLEDDFIFNEEIKNKKNINNINNFLIKYKPHQYYLGCLPFLLIPYDYNNYINISIGCHAVIYSKECRNKILNLDQKIIDDWDYFNNIYFINNRFCYYKPLCYQLFTDTENSKKWGKNTIFKSMTKYFNVIFFYIIKKLNMNVNVEPGYTYFYMFTKILFLIIIIIILKKIYKNFKINV